MIAAIATVLVVTLVIVKPAMPDGLVLLTGPGGSADNDLGKRYAEDLRRRGLAAEVVATEGPREILRRLAEGKDAVGFLPSALDPQGESGIDATRIVALGSVGFSPLWLFHRSDLDVGRIQDLAGRTIATEGRGSTGHYVARRMIESNDLTGEVTLRPVAGQTAREIVDGFSAGTLDAAFVTGAADAPLVRALLDADAAELMSSYRADAYAALIPGTTTLTAPEGVLDLRRNVPPQDTRLLATTFCLAAHEGLHPAVVPMLLVTAENVREATTTFSTTVSFPSREYVTLPLDLAARRYFDRGETGLSRLLSYRAARSVRHLGLVVLPLLAAVLVLLRLAPTVLRSWSGFRLKRLLKKLESVEKQYAAGGDRAPLLRDLDRVDQASARTFVPMSTVHDYIDFRQFLHDMRERVRRPPANPE